MAFGDSDENEDDDGAEEGKQRRHFIIMCFFHVLLNIRKHKFVNGKNRNPLKADLKVLHLCDSRLKFHNGCALFLRKWKRLESEATRLLNKTFFKKNTNWYIGCRVCTPKHNNGMENFNSTMKRCQRQSLKQFLSVALAIVKKRVF